MYRSFKQVLHHRLMNGQRSQYRSFPLVSTGAQPSLQRSNLISVYSLLTYRKIKAKTTSAETREIEFVKASHVAIRISSIIYSNQTFPYSTKQLICQFFKKSTRVFSAVQPETVFENHETIVCSISFSSPFCCSQISDGTNPIKTKTNKKKRSKLKRGRERESHKKNNQETNHQMI